MLIPISVKFDNRDFWAIVTQYSKPITASGRISPFRSFIPTPYVTSCPHLARKDISILRNPSQDTSWYLQQGSPVCVATTM